MIETTEKFEISDAVKSQIDQWLKKYPADRKRSALCPVLLMVQEQNDGWLNEAAMEAVAEYLGLAKIEVYEVATFYDLFELKPVGKHKIGVCTNLPCMLRGSEKIVETLKNRLGVGLGETTKDRLFYLRECECMGACVSAPMCQVDNKHYHENLTPEKMNTIIDDIIAQESK